MIQDKYNFFLKHTGELGIIAKKISNNRWVDMIKENLKAIVLIYKQDEKE